MRKILSVILCVILIAHISMTTVFAVSPTVTVDRVSGNAGETVDVTVELENCTGFINIALEFCYNSSVLTLESVTNGVPGAQMTKAQTLTKNPYNVTWNSTENVVYSGTMVTLRFKIADGAEDGVYPITVDYYKGPSGNSKDGVNVNYNENLEGLGLSYVSGAVTVGNGASDEVEGAYVKVNTASAAAGEAVDVTVALENCAGFINIALEFGYDSSVLTLESVTNGVPGAQMTKAQTLTKNPYNVTWNSTENVLHSGTMVTLRFKVADDAEAGVYPITVDYYKGPNGNAMDGANVNYDENLEGLGLSYVSGALTVKPSEHTLSAQIDETDSGIAITVNASAPGEMSGIIVATLYKDSRAVKVEAVDANESVNISFAEKGDSVGVMWWSDFADLIPLCESIELELDGN